MDQTRTIPANTAIVCLLWIVTAAVFAAGWIVMMTGDPNVGVMLGFTTVMLAAVAAVGTVRIYAIQTRSLIRAVHGLDGAPASPVRQPSSDLRPIR